MSQSRVQTARETAAGPASIARFVTFRAVALGLVVMPLNAYWLTWNVWYQYHLTGDTPLFNTAVFILVVLLGANFLVGRIWPRKRLAPGELLVIYIMVTFGTAMCANGWDWMTNLPTFLTYPSRFATPANAWETRVLPQLPAWLIVTDPTAVTGFWEGQMSPYRPAVLAAWWRPVLWWTSLLVAAIWVLLCANSLLRRRWAEEEKMAFPIVDVPLALVRPGEGLWASRPFQIGVALTVAVNLVNLLSSFFPAIPGFSFSFDYGQFIRNVPPWSGIRQPFFWYSPFLIGFCYLMPLDLLFSLWVFTLAGKLEQVLTIQFGWNTQTWSGPPYIDSQAFGAMLALAGTVFWLDRGYWWTLLRGALFGRGPLGDREEALSHRGALLGMAVGLGYLWWFLSRMGVSWPGAAGLLLLFLIVSLSISRIRAQLGAPHHELMLAGSDAMLAVFGSNAFDGQTLGAFTLLSPFTAGQRCNPSPLTLEALRMGQGRTNLRALPIPIMLAAAMGVLSLFWANLQIHYPQGAGLRSNMAPVSTAAWRYSALAQDLNQPSRANWAPALAMAAGAAAYVGLMAIKLRWPTFPLHPVALPVATGGAIEGTVAAVFIAWLIKACVLRWGGQRLYRPSLYLMFGVIIGDATASSLVAIARQVLGVPVGGGGG